MNLSINNVINVSVIQPGAGLGEYNTSNLAIFTDEAFADSFGTLGYKLYLDPSEVATDFGTDSKTFKEANAIFSQQPNILAGDGYLVVIPMDAEEQHLAFSATPTSGTFIFNYGGNASAPINWNDTALMVQTKIRAIEGLSEVVVTGSITLSPGMNVTYNGVEGDLVLATITSNTLNSSITVTVTQVEGGETLAAAVTRTVELIEYFGILTTSILGQTETLAAAAVIQALNKLVFFVQRDSATVQPAGLLDQLRSGSFNQCRGLYYGADDADADTADLQALIMAASYAGRALSTNFDGSNTTQTMHLKDLIGVQPDPSMDQTTLDACQTAGADVYISIQGVSKTFCSGANTFFDDVYNLLWFIGDIKVSGFNVLAETGTKITQTESGVQILKSAYRGVCEQAVTNQFLAPGKWTSATTFGIQSDFYANISQRGYYIYSSPISQQSPADRDARQAPLIQIAIKYAGAIHSSDVIVYINK